MTISSAWKTPWPWGIVAAFAVVMVANAAMIRAALQHPSAPVTEDHYGDAQSYDTVLEEQARTRDLRWNVSLEACPQGLAEHGCELRLLVRDFEDAPVDGLRGLVEARRADDVRYDREASIRPLGEGTYVAELPLVAPGLYRLKIRLEGGLDPWVGRRDILVPGGDR